MNLNPPELKGNAKLYERFDDNEGFTSSDEGFSDKEDKTNPKS